MIRERIIFGVAAALAASSATAEIACGANGAPEGAVEMREAILGIGAVSATDAKTPYAAFLIPATWKDEGAVALDGADPCGVTEKPRWRAMSPDGASSIEILPGEGWTVSAHAAQFSACPSRDSRSAATHAAALIKSGAPGASVVDVRERTDIVEPFKDQIKRLGETGARVEVTAAEMSFEARMASGETEYGLLVAAVTTFTPAASIPEYETRATALPSLLARSRGKAPDAALVEAVRASALTDPNWVRRREEAMRPPGYLPDLQERSIRRWTSEPFPVRETGAGAANACGQSFATLTIANLWKAEDGRFWFSPALTAALAAAP